MILEFIQDLKSSVKIHLKSQWVSSFKDITTAANLRAIRCIVTLRWQLLIYLSHDCFIRAEYVNLGKSSRKWCLQRRNFINNLLYKNKSSAPEGKEKFSVEVFVNFLFLLAQTNLISLELYVFMLPADQTINSLCINKPKYQGN